MARAPRRALNATVNLQVLLPLQLRFDPSSAAMPACNAKNHRWNCACGFGGSKGSRSTRSLSSETSDLFAVPKVPRRYTKPNERCAFCDAPVFFRRLANGGRVCFDDPGSPWRKHPCTDRASKSYLGPFGGTRDGWPQVSKLSAETVGSDFLRLTGELAGQHWHTFVRCDAFGNNPMSASDLSHSFVQAKPALEGMFSLAVLTPDLKRRLVAGYPIGAITSADQP